MQKALLVLIAILCIAVLFGQDEIEKITDYVQHEIESIIHGRETSVDDGKTISLNDNQNDTETTYAEEDYYSMGLAKAAHKDYEGALEDFNMEIELNPENAWAYYDRGLTKARLNDIDGACSDWLKAAELGYSADELVQKYCR